MSDSSWKSRRTGARQSGWESAAIKMRIGDATRDDVWCDSRWQGLSFGLIVAERQSADILDCRVIWGCPALFCFARVRRDACSCRLRRSWRDGQYGHASLSMDAASRRPSQGRALPDAGSPRYKLKVRGACSWIARKLNAARWDKSFRHCGAGAVRPQRSPVGTGVVGPPLPSFPTLRESPTEDLRGHLRPTRLPACA
jgi:hypothetical protein